MVLQDDKNLFLNWTISLRRLEEIGKLALLRKIISFLVISDLRPPRDNSVLHVIAKVEFYFYAKIRRRESKQSIVIIICLFFFPYLPHLCPTSNLLCHFG